MARRGALADFVDDLQVGGRLTFARDEALAALGVTTPAPKQAALAPNGPHESVKEGL